MIYLLFGNTSTYYANGGAHDFIGAYLTFEEALFVAQEKYTAPSYAEAVEWWHIFDLHQNKIVAMSDEKPHKGSYNLTTIELKDNP